MLDKFHSLSPRERILLGGLLIVILLSFYKLVLEKQINTYTEVKACLEQARQDLAQAKKLLAEEKNIEEQSKEIEDKITPILPYFNTRMHPGYVLADFNWQAYQHGVVLEKVKPLVVVDKKHYLEIPLTLQIRGSFNHIAQYIKVLESLTVVSEIRRVDFRPPNKEKTLGLEEVSIAASDWQQSDEVIAQLDLILFTDPEAKLSLERGKALGEQWLVGRPKAFESVQPTSPIKQMTPPQPPKVDPKEELIGN